MMKYSLEKYYGKYDQDLTLGEFFKWIELKFRPDRVIHYADDNILYLDLVEADIENEEDFEIIASMSCGITESGQFFMVLV
jgi:hypothetical protein